MFADIYKSDNYRNKISTSHPVSIMTKKKKKKTEKNFNITFDRRPRLEKSIELS